MEILFKNCFLRWQKKTSNTSTPCQQTCSPRTTCPESNRNRGDQQATQGPWNTETPPARCILGHHGRTPPALIGVVATTKILSDQAKMQRQVLSNERPTRNKNHFQHRSLEHCLFNQNSKQCGFDLLFPVWTTCKKIKNIGLMARQSLSRPGKWRRKRPCDALKCL